MTSKKNIVFLTDCLADLAGGAEKQIFELAKQLDKNKYNVHIVSLESWGQAPRDIIESSGSALHLFKVVRIYGFSGLFQGIKFYQFLQRNRIDILMTYHFSSDIWGTFWGHLAQVPMIISNRRDMGFWRNEWHIRTYKLINNLVTKIVVVSESIKEMIVTTEGVRESRIEVIYNGVHLPETTSTPGVEVVGLGLREDDLLIVHVANLKPVKGHKYLIEAFAQVTKQHPNAKLLLIGKDELNGQIQQLTARLNIQKNVIFLGKRDDISQILKLADICILPSLSEGMSNSILEYMAAGKAVIATNVGGNPELIKDQFNGLLVEAKNTQALQEAIITLLNNKTMRQSMGQHGFERVKNEFSMPAMISRYEKVFQKKISVLQLVSSGGLFGAERVILNLAFQAQGARFWVGGIHNQHNPHLEIIEEARKLGLKSIAFDSRGQVDLNTVIAIRRFMKDNDIDVLHTHNYKSDALGFLATRFNKVKWMTTNHVWHGTDPKLKFYEDVDSFISKFALKIVAVSNEIRDNLIKSGFNKQRVEMIANGIPIKNFKGPFLTRELRSELGLKPGEITIAIIGRLAPEKGHAVFLKAAVQVVQKAKNIKFLIVGDGPLRDSLKQQTKELNLTEYVIFTGIRQDMPSIYACCDIMVNASFIEGMPMTILEAMASGLPVIVTRVGGVGDVIQNNVNGLLLEAGNDATLAQALLSLIDHKDQRERLQQQALHDVNQNYSDEIMAQKYAHIYAGII